MIHSIKYFAQVDKESIEGHLLEVGKLLCELNLHNSCACAPVGCKAMQTVMESQYFKLVIHDCLRGFTAGRGTDTAIMEVKLAQQLAYLEQVPLYGLFIDLCKAFDAMDCKRCL